jgi:dolichyl-diphosphooligosaccharide--protein glycosyltransferase
MRLLRTKRAGSLTDFGHKTIILKTTQFASEAMKGNNATSMRQGKSPPRFVFTILLVLFFGIALYIRVALPYDSVFSGDWTKFAEADAYYHMRLVDNLLRNFPHFLAFDPYTAYPSGASVGWAPFFDWLLAGIIWMVSLGSPTPHTIDAVGAYFPAILGALTVIPVYFIGKELFNRWAGIISAGLVAILPGEFLTRSILGFTDHHVAETLFSTISILFLILAIKSARERQLTFNHIRRRDWLIITRPLAYSLLTGIFLGIYLLSWVGGLFFVFIISVYFIIQFILDNVRGESSDYLGIVGTVSWLVALALSLPLLPQTWVHSLYLPSLLVAILIPLVSSGISRAMVSKRIKRAYYPLILVVLGLAGLAIFYMIAPELVSSAIRRFNIFTPEGASLTILEVRPILFLGGKFTFQLVWGNFATGFFLSFISLGFLIYLVIKRGSADKSLLVVWSLIILAATFAQRRFAYYFAVNVALLTGYLSFLIYYVIRFIIDYFGNKSTDFMSWQILEFSGLEEPTARSVQSPRRAKRRRANLKKRGKAGFHPTVTYASISLWVIVVFFLVFFPNIKQTISTASMAPFAPSDAWCSALSWLRENTPEPFGSPDAYYKLYPRLPWKVKYEYPESAYGIMAWWDYGHWITRIAHRIPISNPFQQGASEAGEFFIAQDETSANKMMDELGARYTIIDNATVMAKFFGVVAFAGRQTEEFYSYYYQPKDGQLEPVRLLYYPEYYRSLAVRLYNFDGKAVTPEECMVISYEEKMTGEGIHYKQVIGSWSFTTYEEATSYVAGQKSGNYAIGSPNPFNSPVPLEELRHYKLIYSSDSFVMYAGVGRVPAVKIFEYQK